MSKDSTFVAGGRKRFKESKQYQRQVAKIQARIEEKYQPERDQANFFQKWFISYKMRKEIRQEVEALLPADTLFFSAMSN